jgi:hypothetical protein
MANENWKPGTGKSIPTNTPIKVDPKFTTVGLPGANNGFVPFGRPGQGKAYYSINEFGEVAFKFGPNAPNLLDFLSGKTYTTLNDLAASRSIPALTGVEIRTRLQSRLQSDLEERAPQLGIRPSQTQPEPTPTQGAEGGGTTSEEEAVISEGFEEVTKDLTKSFDTLNFGKLESFFKYPLDMDDNQDRITFSQYKYVATKLDRDINSIVNEFANRDSAFTDIYRDSAFTDILGTVTLPVPNQISESNQTGWGESNLSTIAALGMKGLSESGDKLTEGNLLGAGGEILGTMKSFLGGASSRAQSFLTAKIAAQIIGKLGVSVDPEQFLTRISGGVINPNLELLFNGPKLRPFAFSFKMSPTDQDEARNIRAIIKFFKSGMAPQRSKKAQVNLYLGSPNVFKIQFESRGNQLDGLPRIKTCALQSCAVNYAPDGVYAAYDDSKVGSQPVAIEIQLQFIELTPVFADEYNLENENVPIGPDNLGRYEIESESSQQPGDSSPVADPAAREEALNRGGVPDSRNQTNRRGGG